MTSQQLRLEIHNITITMTKPGIDSQEKEQLRAKKIAKQIELEELEEAEESNDSSDDLKVLEESYENSMEDHYNDEIDQPNSPFFNPLFNDFE